MNDLRSTGISSRVWGGKGVVRESMYISYYFRLLLGVEDTISIYYVHQKLK